MAEFKKKTESQSFNLQLLDIKGSLQEIQRSNC